MYLFLCVTKIVAESAGDVRSNYMTAIAITTIICITIVTLCLIESKK
jgi:hypothetical protein